MINIVTGEASPQKRFQRYIGYAPTMPRKHRDTGQTDISLMIDSRDRSDSGSTDLKWCILTKRTPL